MLSMIPYIYAVMPDREISACISNKNCIDLFIGLEPTNRSVALQDFAPGHSLMQLVTPC